MATKGKLLYREIADDLRQAIRQGGLKPGQALPKVRDLAAHYQCSLQTVHRALKLVADEGLILTRQGAGCRVRDPQHERGTRILAVFEDQDGLRDQSEAALFLLGATAGATNHSLNIETLTFRATDDLAGLIDKVRADSYAGLIWGGLHAPALIGKLDGMGLKQVFIRRSPRLLRLPATRDELQDGAQRLTAALVEQGTKSLACVGPPADGAARVLDMVAAEAQVQDVEVPMPKGRFILPRSLPDAEARLLMQHFLASNRDVDAFWFTDPSQLSLAKELRHDMLASKTVVTCTNDDLAVESADLVLRSDTRGHAREAANLLYHWLRTGKRPGDVRIPMGLNAG